MAAQRLFYSNASGFEGQYLNQLCKAPMEIQRFLPLAIQIAAAVADLHRDYIIHKDIKPANILIDLENGTVRILDSGISSQAPRERHIAQNPTTIQATLAYMSPEQTGRMNRMLDYRTDLYSMGVTFYEMLTGRLPFQADTALEWVYCHVAQKPPPLITVLPNLPQPINDIVMHLLAKMAEDRYQSARALMVDLETCLTQWEATGQIATFALGTQEVSDNFRIPQRLYGRENEVAELLAAFDRMADTGTPEFVLVSGYSGIGKSSVVNELHKPLLQACGSFLSGKFDQYKRDIPYATITEAALGLVRQVLAGSEIEVMRWKQRMEAALEDNGQLIIGVIPQVELVLGKQPPVPELPPLQAQHRFQRVFGRFLGVFAAPEHPLTLFLDDLQWADAASLDLLEHLLTDHQITHLMVVGAYRDNEITPAHPLTRMIEAIRHKLNLVDIRLGPLDRLSLCQMVTDTLHCSPTDAESLVVLLQEKTAGNPFFTEQFLQMLYRDGMIWFDHACQQWRWDVVPIRSANVTNNVVKLMAGQIAGLEPEACEALKIAACIGNRFDLVTLAQVMNQSLAYVTECLDSAVWKGLLLSSAIYTLKIPLSEEGHNL